MNVEELNKCWSTGHALEFFGKTPEFAAAKMRHSSGAELEVGLYGGQVLSWIVGGRERLFLSQKADFVRGKAIRGGVPIVFPQFGSGTLPAHGFARTSEFFVRQTSVEEGGRVNLTLGLIDSAETRRVWPHNFSLSLLISLGEDLYMELLVENTGAKALEFQSLLHTYFSVPDIRAVRVRGFEGVSFSDFLNGGRESVDNLNDRPITEQTDQLYIDAPDFAAILDEASCPLFQVEKERFGDFVLWNPWIEKSAQMADLSPNDYLKFLCLEAGNVRSKIALSPGESFTSSQRLMVI